MQNIPEKHVNEVCKVGKKEKCCRYLSMGPGGWTCLKMNAFMRKLFDERVKTGTMKAIGDNCPGYGGKNAS